MQDPRLKPHWQNQIRLLSLGFSGMIPGGVLARADASSRSPGKRRAVTWARSRRGRVRQRRPLQMRARLQMFAWGVGETRCRGKPPLATYRKRVSELLASNEGPAMRRRNATNVETAFDDVKRNRDFRRLAPWGLGEVSREWRLLMMGRNMVKPPKAVSMSEKPTL